MARTARAKKKADVAHHPKVIDHVGLLFNKPPGTARAAPCLVLQRIGINYNLDWS